MSVCSRVGKYRDEAGSHTPDFSLGFGSRISFVVLISSSRICTLTSIYHFLSINALFESHPKEVP